MYLEFYRLQEYPFSLRCDERFFYESPAHAEALANMLYTIQQRKGMVLVTGEVGAGKTFVGHVLRSRLGAGCLTLAMANPPQSPKQLLRALAKQLGIHLQSNADKLGIVEELREHLVRLCSRGRLVAAIIDEAQGLPAGAMEEIRLLWNWELDGIGLVQIVMIGQPELRRRLHEPQWEPLCQRIALSFHLRQLPAQDTAEYVRHRLRVAGAGRCLAEFAPEALAEIHEATGGIPRLINVLCDNALLVGYSRGTHLIDRPVITEVLRDMTCWDMLVHRGLAQPEPVAAG